MIVAGGSVYDGTRRSWAGSREWRSRRTAASGRRRSACSPRGNGSGASPGTTARPTASRYNAVAAAAPTEAKDAAKTSNGSARSGRLEAEARRQRRRREVRPRHAPRRARPSQRNDAALPARRRDDRPGAARRAAIRSAGSAAASAPYKEWTWHETKHRLGGPNFIRLPDGTLWAAGRSYPGGAKTVLARMTPTGDYEPVLDPPQRRRHELRRSGLARRTLVDELLLVARGQVDDLPGEDQSACPVQLLRSARVAVRIQRRAGNGNETIRRLVSRPVWKVPVSRGCLSKPPDPLCGRAIKPVRPTWRHK